MEDKQITFFFIFFVFFIKKIYRFSLFLKKKFFYLNNKYIDYFENLLLRLICEENKQI